MAKSGSKKPDGPAAIVNRRARYDYEILSTYEAGIALEGSEVKSVFRGQVNLSGAYCRVDEGEAWLYDMDIAPYEKAGSYAPERQRKRKLLLHKKEIELIRRRSEERGLALIPTRVYFQNRRVKVEISIARGRRQYDKREKIDAKTARRESESGD
ncbi:MAG: SsrA-binding protein SmpB [Fimbriimonadales bacterium]